MEEEPRPSDMMTSKAFIAQLKCANDVVFPTRTIEIKTRYGKGPFFGYWHTRNGLGKILSEAYCIRIAGMRNEIANHWLKGVWKDENLSLSFYQWKIGFVCHEVRHRIQQRKRYIRKFKPGITQSNDPTVQKAFEIVNRHWEYLRRVWEPAIDEAIKAGLIKQRYKKLYLAREFDAIVIQPHWAAVVYISIVAF